METFTLYPDKTISLNDFLRNKLPDLVKSEISNSKVRRLIISGSVYVDKRQNRIPSFLLHKNNIVEVSLDLEKLFFEKPVNDIGFELSPEDVLFEDEYIIIVNKPSHFPTEAGMVKSRDNLHSAVVRFLFERQKKEHPNMKNPPYVGIMHRLDRDTSGVILFTKMRTVNTKCHDMFENHTAKKVYNAIVCADEAGKNFLKKSKEFSVSFPMGRISPKGQPAKWGKLSENNGGLPSKTDFSLLEQIDENHFLIECRPLTGRTHQIRVHLSSKNIPILGDVLYSGKTYERIMLHAKNLTFNHPVTGDELCIEAPLPAEFNTIHAASAHFSTTSVSS